MSAVADRKTRTRKGANRQASKGASRTSEALPRKTDAQKRRAAAIYDALLKCYPDAHCELDYANPLELLVATILSAQALDSSVNKVTPALFKKFRRAADYTRVTPQQIETYINRIGLYRNKSKSIHGAMTMIERDFDGNVPNTMESLLKLPGVARKTANVVLGNAFNKNEGVVVDTHVIRVGQRLGLTKHSDPKKIERDLMALYPRERWCMLSHLLIFHGRRACKARGALCHEHPVCVKYCSNARKACSVGRPLSLPACDASTTRRHGGLLH
jgi:endonuclease-3